VISTRQATRRSNQEATALKRRRKGEENAATAMKRAEKAAKKK